MYKKKKKKKFKPEIKSIIKNLQDELYQLENKQAKGAKLRAKVKWGLKVKNATKYIFQTTWKKEYAKSNNI